MKVFLIDIRNENNQEEYQMCSDILMDYFNRNHIDVFVLKENKFDVHPSWLKLRCFDHIEDDFVLCWDLDLLPKRSCPSILNYLDFGKINLAVDSTLILKNQGLFIPEFRYNCGLIGIPRTYKKPLEEIFDTCKNSDWPSWEQYHVNRYLAQNGFADVHELDKSWNCQFHPTSYENQFILSAKSVHFTGVNVDGGNRKELINRYHSLYFKNQ